MNGNSPIPFSKRKACLRCATSKAKCSFIEGQRVCQRCTRLRRECLVEDAHLRQKRKNATRVEKLEKKVDRLLALLTPSNNEIQVGSSNAVVNLSTPAATEDTDSPLDESEPPRFQTIATAPRTVSNVDEVPRDIIDRRLLTIDAAEILLERFKTLKMPHFPFVVIPPRTSAATMRQQCPFLFLAVITACLDENDALQKVLGSEIMKIFGQRVLFDNERSLELLQGLLIHVAWNHYHFYATSKQMYMLIQMAVTLVADLGLNRCPVHAGCAWVGAHVEREPNGGRSAAENRALLGCYYLCSTMSIMRKNLAMPHTKWIDQCCNLLEEGNEHPTDASIKAFIQARSLTHRISDTFSSDPDMDSGPNEALLQMSMNNFRRELAQIESALRSSNEQKNHSLILELKALPVSLHEVALYQHGSHATSFSSLHTSTLWTLLQSSHDLLTSFLNIPTEDLKLLPSSAFMLMWYGFVILSNIVRLPSGQGWDRAIAKKEATVSELGSQAKDKFGSLSKTGTNVELRERDVWSFFYNAMGAMLIWHKKYELQVGGETEGEKFSGILPSAPNSSCCAVGDLLTACTTLVSQHIKEVINNNREEERRSVVAGTESVQRSQAERQEEIPSTPWDDVMWQSMLDDFSLFPPASTMGYQAGSTVPF